MSKLDDELPGYLADERRFLEDTGETLMERSLENMVLYYRKDLLRIHASGRLVDDQSALTVFQKYGLVEFGASRRRSKGPYVLTPVALEILGLNK